MNRIDPETELRALWNAAGVPEDRQNAIIADVVAKAQPAAIAAMFPAKPPTPRHRVAVVYHKGISRHWYWIARMVELDGELFVLPLPKGSYTWQERQFFNRREAFATAREAGDVHPFLVIQDYARRNCVPVKQLGA